MPIWEYRKVHPDASPHAMNDIELLNAAGGEGWEVVHITDTSVAYLKRARRTDPGENRRQDKYATGVRAKILQTVDKSSASNRPH
jgi:hypothetical protein